MKRRAGVPAAAAALLLLLGAPAAALDLRGGGGSGGGMAIGNAVSGGTPNRLLRQDASGNLADSVVEDDGTNVRTAAKLTFGTAADAANSMELNGSANCWTAEGSAADGVEGRLCFPANYTGGDHDWFLPANTGAGRTDTLGAIANNQTWTGTNTFNDARLPSNSRIANTAAGGAYFGHRTAMTPDAGYIGVDNTTGNSFHFMEHQDEGFDWNNGPCGTGNCSTPTWIGHSGTQNTTHWWSLTHNGTNPVADSGLGIFDFPDGIRSSNTGSIGWTVATGTNVACDSACTSACVVGLDVVAGFQACSSATSETCVCAGAS